jgi:hypothetical protein
MLTARLLTKCTVIVSQNQIGLHPPKYISANLVIHGSRSRTAGVRYNDCIAITRTIQIPVCCGAVWNGSPDNSCIGKTFYMQHSRTSLGYVLCTANGWRGIGRNLVGVVIVTGLTESKNVRSGTCQANRLTDTNNRSAIDLIVQGTRRHGTGSNIRMKHRLHPG